MEENPQKSPSSKQINKEIRINVEILNSDLLLASASQSSERGGANYKKINNSLRIAQWNIRGLNNQSKLHTINAIDCQIFALQEVDHPKNLILDQIHNLTPITKKERETDKRGGGTMTLSNLNITHKIEENINKDCNLTRIVIDGVFVIWIGNIYLNRGLPKQINKLFSIIQTKIPTHEQQNIILLGDFNININNKSPKLTLLNSLCKQFNLDINHPQSGTRMEATLDFLISGKGIEATIKDNLKSCSDHNILIWDINFKATSKPKKNIHSK